MNKNKKRRNKEELEERLISLVASLFGKITKLQILPFFHEHHFYANVCSFISNRTELGRVV